MRYLRQSTASQEIILGPFVDSIDGVTPETALTIAATDIKVYKAGATTSANKTSGGATHDAAGRYSAVLDATDTNTLGSGEIHVSVAGALPVIFRFTVLPGQVFDSLILGSDLLTVDTNEISGTAASAIGVLDSGTAQSATSTTMVLRAAAAFADDALIGATIIQVGGTNSPQAARVTDYVGSTDTATVVSWPNGTPGGTITYVIIATTPDSGSGGGLDAAGTRAALGMSAANLDAQIATLATATALATVDTVVDAILVDTDVSIPALLTTIDNVVDSIQADTDNIQTRLPAALVGGRIDASVGAMAAGTVTAAAIATNAIDADAIAADAVTEIQAGLATAAALSAVSSQVSTVDAVVDAVLEDTGTTLPGSLATIAGYVDTEVAAIKAKTDQLVFDGTHLEVAVKKVGTTTLNTGGTGGQGYGG
jgi:hypothetical protein